MDLTERALYLAIGGVLGFILGYVVALLRTIKSKVDHMEQEVHEVHENSLESRIKGEFKDDLGVFWPPTLLNVMLLLVVVLTVFAAFSTAKTNSELDETVACLTSYNTNQNNALTTRDAAIRAAAAAEIDLWTLYGNLYREGTLPNTTPERVEEIQEELAAAVSDYRDELISTQMVREQYEYDDPNILQDCEKVESE